MRLAKTTLSLALAATLFAGGVAWADDDARVRKDLQTVITLQGKPCGKVTKAEKQGENDYIVTCETGDRYRVTIDENDRVIVKKL